MRAAQYVRMSTEHQQYSIENQIAAIAVYAAEHEYDVVQTYSDPAKSGLDLAHRPGLRQLLQDVVGPTPGFEAILVYDVSRWGRFQDVDESAYWEFVCKSAGIQIHYCAETFVNDGSPMASLLKTLKRAMAGEFIRELSEKVFAGQCRVARSGYKLGGTAGYGLRRLLVDSNGQRKGVLQFGEHKSLITDRVTYIHGSEDEVRVVREIYHMFLEEDASISAITRSLNERGVWSGSPRCWLRDHVRAILTHPKYAGCIVFNQHSGKLRSTPVPNPRSQWIIRPASFQPIISPEYFERVQQKLQKRTFNRTNDQLLLELRTLATEHGRLSTPLITAAKESASPGTYRARFGSLIRAYELIQYSPTRSFEWVENRRTLLDLRALVQDEFLRELARAGIRVSRTRQIFKLRGKGRVVLKMAKCLTLCSGDFRWDIHAPYKSPGCRCIVTRLNQDASIRDYILLDSLPAKGLFRLDERVIHDIGCVFVSLRDVVEAIAGRLSLGTDASVARRSSQIR